MKIDPELHREVVTRYKALNIEPYSGFVNPEYTIVKDEEGKIVDVKISYTKNYIQQMLGYAENYSFLPNEN